MGSLRSFSEVEACFVVLQRAASPSGPRWTVQPGNAADKQATATYDARKAILTFTAHLRVRKSFVGRPKPEG